MSQRSRIPASWRQYYNDLLRLPAWLNAQFWRLRLRAFPKHNLDPILINLGCGKDYRKGFVNVDVNFMFHSDMWLDFRNHLPWPDEHVDGIFCSHVLEHFTYLESMFILRECRRILRPGGTIRVAVPGFASAIEAYLSGNRAFFHAEGRSLGRLFSEHLMDSSNHRQLFDESFLAEALEDAGFERITRAQYGVGYGPDPVSRTLALLDNRPEISIFAEAIR
jgi:predicted SAM-dependent methyltransferase